MKKLAILGCTGSIGVQALETVEASNGALSVVSLAAGKNINLLRDQIKKFKPQLVSVSRADDATLLRKEFPAITFASGEEGLVEAATVPEANIVLVAIVGVAALEPTLEAIKLGKDIALASKEILVAAGQIIMAQVKKHGVKLLPVDSEHSAIMQSCPPTIVAPGYLEYPTETISKIILTASGGAFRDLPEQELKNKTLADALKHPNWSMGKKITIDSATLMNKGLEVIEAHWLFNLPYEKIDVVIHPQSIIHSLVEYVDGSQVAQLGLPDMRLPIQYALYYPQRKLATWPKLKLTDLKSLTFQTPDLKKYRGLALAYQAGKAGGTAPCVFNAANEQAVNLFLEEKIRFTEIVDLVESVLQKHSVGKGDHLSELIAADLWARDQVLNIHV